MTVVEGTVTKDGRPLQGIEVIFMIDLESGTQGLRSMGFTDEAGHYRLRTSNGEDGAVIGKYRVLVRDLEANSKQALALWRGESVKGSENEKKSSRDASRTPLNYSSYSGTPLRAEVGREPLVFDIAIP